MSDEIVVVVPIKAAPGRVDDVIAAFTPCIEATVLEEGCIRYALHQDVADPDALVHIEVWRSQADLDAHAASPHLADLIVAMSAPGLLAGAPAMTTLRALGVGGAKGVLPGK